jgi:hypothetical protein
MTMIGLSKKGLHQNYNIKIHSLHYGCALSFLFLKNFLFNWIKSSFKATKLSQIVSSLKPIQPAQVVAQY